MSLESINRLVQLSGRGYRTVKKNLESLTPTKDGRKKLYESTEALPLIFDVGTTGETGTPQQEKARLDKLRADEVEHRLDISKRAVAPLHILENTLNHVSEMINAVLDSLPLKLKKRCPNLSGRDIEMVRREIVKLSNSMSTIQLDEKAFRKITEKDGD
jgi:phage terminase Nu1 subunit (DNA packaging protein)